MSTPSTERLLRSTGRTPTSTSTSTDEDVKPSADDEKDNTLLYAGVGGAVAAAVGDRLNKLGDRLQVLVVTHSPQVAARGNFHWKVMKVGDDDESKTTASRLEKQDRIEEIARMLAGEVVTEEARAASMKLLES